MSRTGGMPISIELVIQEALVVGMHALASDVRSMSQLVRRVDGLRHNTADDWHRELRHALVDMLDPSSQNYVTVLLNLPAGQAKLPALSILEESGGENDAEQVVGKVLRESNAFVGPNQELMGEREIGGGETTNLEITAWDTVMERALLLRAAARWALYNQQEALINKGVHEFSVSTAGVQVPPELEPRVTYAPLLNVRFNWTWRQSLRKVVPNRITIRTGSFST